MYKKKSKKPFGRWSIKKDHPWKKFHIPKSDAALRAIGEIYAENSFDSSRFRKSLT